MSIDKINVPKSESEHIDESNKKFLMSDESFALLTKAQSRIKEATEVTPTLRKLINMLITPESVETIIEELITLLKGIQAKL